MLERRQHERLQTTRGCKLRAVARPGFSPAQTTNLSLGGALLCVPNDRPYAPGDEVELALPLQGQSLVRSDELIRARIRRVVPIDHHQQALGLQFAEELVHEAALAA
jgi:c-di-GMP-binding flagellar brake protein YcgR